MHIILMSIPFIICAECLLTETNTKIHNIRSVNYFFMSCSPDIIQLMRSNVHFIIKLKLLSGISKYV